MSEYTQGPWTLGKVQYKHWRHSGKNDAGNNFKHPNGCKSRGIIILAHPNGNEIPNTIAEILESNFNLDFEANARLIAAAPDLLEVLQDLVKEYEIDDGIKSNYWDRAKFAIAKARGRE